MIPLPHGLRCHFAGALGPDSTFDGFGHSQLAPTATALAFMQQVKACCDQRLGVSSPHQLKGTIEKPDRQALAVHAGLGSSPDHTRFWVQDAQVGVVAVVVWPREKADKVVVSKPIGAFLEAHLEGVMPLQALLKPVLVGHGKRESRIASNNKVFADRLHEQASKW